MLDFPENVQQARFGTAEFFRSTRANLDRFVVYLKDLDLQEAYTYYPKLSRMLRFLLTKSREEQGLKPVTNKHIARQAREALNLLCYRRYGEIFDTKEIINYVPRAPSYKKRPSRRKRACTTHSGACFKNEACANWSNQIQCGKDCPKKDKCGNRFIAIDNPAFKGIQLYCILESF